MGIKITLPDGSKQAYEKGVTPAQIAEKIGPRLASAAVAAKVDSELVDLDRPLDKDAKFEIVTFDSKDGKEVFWHTSAHLLAHAVRELYPKAKFAIGPPIENGFYYDFEMPPIHPDELPKIEQKMKELAKKDMRIERVELSKAEAKKIFKDEPYKLELIEEFGDKLTAYKQGDFIDLCRGPHLPSTGRIKGIKVTKGSSAYWRGDQAKQSLQRIYGITFPQEKELAEYLRMLEEAEKRDHRKIGKQLDLFSIHDEGPGFVFWHNNGMVIFNELINFLKEELRKRDYCEVRTPILLRKGLWVKSGHWDHYKHNMYFTEIDKEEYAIKPMNCPGAILIYKTDVRSYRDLPMRFAEFGIDHRHELSGVLHGLMRVRAFTMDDAHIFCTETHLEKEVLNLIELADHVFSTFGFQYHMELSTRPENSMGSDEVWAAAESALKNALAKKGAKYRVNEGDGAFYGPKIDFHLRDCIGRTWQCTTIQVDFSMPEKFGLTYVGEDGKEHMPIMIHRAIFGSLERFIGVLIEHFAGSFPLWISPLQVRLLNVADRHLKYAEQVRKRLFDEGIRVDIDSRNETVPYKVRDAQLKKANYILVLGDREEKDDTVTVRTRDGKVEGAVKIDEFVKRLRSEIASKKV